MESWGQCGLNPINVCGWALWNWKKREQPESNQRPIGLQPIALPLSYAPMNLPNVVSGFLHPAWRCFTSEMPVTTIQFGNVDKQAICGVIFKQRHFQILFTAWIEPCSATGKKGSSRNRTNDLSDCSRLLYHWAMLPWTSALWCVTILVFEVDHPSQQWCISDGRTFCLSPTEFFWTQIQGVLEEAWGAYPGRWFDPGWLVMLWFNSGSTPWIQHFQMSNNRQLVKNLNIFLIFAQHGSCCSRVV